MNQPYYTVSRLEGLATLRSLFHESTDYELNWLFLSTSGVHGSLTSLDDLEEAWSDYADEDNTAEITALVVKPRVVQILYGNVKLTREDLPWLREGVAKTLQGIADSQSGNVR